MCLSTAITANAPAAPRGNQTAGFGGIVHFPDGSARWIQFQIHVDDIPAAWHWVRQDMQKHIAAWELLAQYALMACFADSIPSNRGPICCHQDTDKSAPDAAFAKGSSMTMAMSTVLGTYFCFMRGFQVP